MKQYKTIGIHTLLASLILLIVLFTGFDWKIISSLKLSITYILFFYLPSLILISSFNFSKQLELITLSILVAAGYSTIYFILNIGVGIQLLKSTFIIVTLLYYAVGIYFFRRNKKNESSVHI